MPFEILKTKDDKGHKFRLMVVATQHVPDVSRYEEVMAKAYLFAEMLLLQDSWDQKNGPFDFAIMERTHATIKDHWHIVACDLWSGMDMEKVFETERMDILSETGKCGNR